MGCRQAIFGEQRIGWGRTDLGSEVGRQPLPDHAPDGQAVDVQLVPVELLHGLLELAELPGVLQAHAAEPSAAAVLCGCGRRAGGHGPSCGWWGDREWMLQATYTWARVRRG